jgi:hypothetical protein
VSGSRQFVFAESKILPSFQQLFGAACLTMVPLTHACEGLQLLPSMRGAFPIPLSRSWGCCPGVTLFPLGYMWQALTKRKDLSAGCRKGGLVPALFALVSADEGSARRGAGWRDRRHPSAHALHGDLLQALKFAPASGKARFLGRDDPRAHLTHAEFLSRAWKLANDKARELGWIV